MNFARLKRKPTAPGEILREEFLAPMGLTQKALADHIGVDIKVINRLVNGNNSVSPQLALKLAAALNTTPQFWMNAQLAVDLHRAASSVRHLPGFIARAG
mgnify:CR=1 FL=1